MRSRANASQIPSRSTTGRYPVSAKPESARNTPTPPRSPHKALPTAPNPASRVSPSHNRKGSTSRSASDSPQTNQSPLNNTQRSSRKGSLTSPRITDFASSPQYPAWISNSPDPSRNGRTPTPDQGLRVQDPPRSSKSPQMGLGITEVKGHGRSASRASQDESRAAKSPELGKSGMSPTPWYKGVTSREAQRPTKSPEPRYTGLRNPEHELLTKKARNDRPFNSTETRSRDIRSHDPIPEESSCVTSPSRMPAQIISNMADASKSSTPESTSRRLSLTERTKSILGRKASVKRDGHGLVEGGRSKSALEEDVNAPKQLSVLAAQAERRPQDLENSRVPRRASSRRNNDPLSLSTNLGSHVYPNETATAPSFRDSNNSESPDQDSYMPLTLLPAQPKFSPLQDAFAASDLAKRSRPVSKYDKQIALPSGGSIKRQAPGESVQQMTQSKDATHPLLQEERHARFKAQTPGHKTPNDLPLRHYHSSTELARAEDDLSQARVEGDKTPRRSSSLIHPQSPIGNPPVPENTQPQPQMAAEQNTPNASSLNLLNQSRTRSPEHVLGVHPAHRQAERDSVSTRTPSPVASTTSSIPEQGATPPPISTGPSHPNSPPNRFGQSPSPHMQTPAPHANMTSDSSTSNSMQQQGGDPSQMPFYLNPASSTALVDFLASSPPPSPPMASHRDQNHVTQPAASTTDVTYNNMIDRNHTASPPPPAPGRSRFGLLSASTTDLRSGTPNGFRGGSNQKKVLGWKKMFGGQPKAPKERKEKSGRKFIQWGRDPPPDEGALYGFGNGKVLDKDKERDGGFMGVGKDGVWISRKNFVRT